MPPARESRTYRVQQLPVDIHITQVADFLTSACADIGPAKNIKVYSVARTLGFTSYATRSTKTATIVFRQTPLIFDNDEEQWSVESHRARWNRNLVFDTHFRGFTALNDVSAEEQQLE